MVPFTNMELLQLLPLLHVTPCCIRLQSIHDPPLLPAGIQGRALIEILDADEQVCLQPLRRLMVALAF